MQNKLFAQGVYSAYIKCLKYLGINDRNAGYGLETYAKHFTHARASLLVKRIRVRPGRHPGDLVNWGDGVTCGLCCLSEFLETRRERESKHRLMYVDPPGISIYVTPLVLHGMNDVGDIRRYILYAGQKQYPCHSVFSRLSIKQTKIQLSVAMVIRTCLSRFYESGRAIRCFKITSAQPTVVYTICLDNVNIT